MTHYPYLHGFYRAYGEGICAEHRLGICAAPAENMISSGLRASRRLLHGTALPSENNGPLLYRITHIGREAYLAADENNWRIIPFSPGNETLVDASITTRVQVHVNRLIDTKSGALCKNPSIMFHVGWSELSKNLFPNASKSNTR